MEAVDIVMIGISFFAQAPDGGCWHCHDWHLIVSCKQAPNGGCWHCHDWHLFFCTGSRWRLLTLSWLASYCLLQTGSKWRLLTLSWLASYCLLQTGFHWRLLTLSLSLANRLPLEAVDIVSISILLPLARKLGLKQDVCCIESSCSGLPSAAVTIMT